MADLILNSHTVFDEPHSPSSLPSTYSRARTSLISFSSFFENSLFAHPRVVGPEGSSATARSSSSVFPSDQSTTNLSIAPRLPSGIYLSPLLGLSPSQSLTTEVDSFDSAIISDSTAVTTPPEAFPPRTSVDEQQLPQQPPYLQVPTFSHSPHHSLPPSYSGSSAPSYPGSSATSVRSGMRNFIH